MEHALSRPEIVQIIAHNADSRTIVACARVSKMWSDIALDEIWHTIRIPDHLLAIAVPWALPLKDKSKDECVGVEEWSSHFRKPDTQLDWDRFFTYSKRVKNFTFTCPTPGAYKTMSFFARLCPKPLLLPRLQHLSMYVGFDENDSVGYLSKYCPETLQDIGLTFSVGCCFHEDERTNGMESTFLAIATKSPNIQSVTITICARNGARVTSLCSAIAGFLRKLKTLKTVTLSGIAVTPQVLGVVAHLPSLQEFRIDATLDSDRTSEWPMIRRKGKQLVFPSLVSLGLRVDHSSFLRSCLLTSHRNAPTRLKNLMLDIHFVRDSESLRTILGGIESNFSSIMELIVCSPMVTSEHRDQEYARCGTLKSPFERMSGLRNLKSFEWTHSHSFAIMDADVLSLVAACPQLETLSFAPSSSRRGAPLASKLSLRTFVYLSKVPNNLRTLELPMRDVTSCDTPDPATLGRHLRSMKSVSLCWRVLVVHARHREERLRFLRACFSEACELSLDDTDIDEFMNSDMN